MSSPPIATSRQEDWESLAPSEDARELARVARQQFASLGSQDVTRRKVAGEVNQDDLWSVLVSSGYPQIGLPDALDGIGDVLDVAVVMAESGFALMSAPLMTSSAGAQLLIGSDLVDTRFGILRGAFGTGTGTVDDGRVTCASVSVMHGDEADVLALALIDGKTVNVVEIDAKSPEVSMTSAALNLDPSRPISRLDITGAPVVQHRTAQLSEYHALMAPARMCVAADLVGTAAGAFDRSLTHVLARRQFGKQLGAFQAVKHQLADAYVLVEKARSLVMGTALAVRDEPMQARTGQLSLLALGSSIQAAVAVSSRCIQLLGAMGVTRESDAHLYLRRAHQSALALESSSAAFRTAAEIERTLDV